MKEEKKEEVGTEQRCQRKQNKKMRKPVKNKIKIAPDSKYNSVRVAKFINYVMERGKKNTARNIVYQSFQNVKEKTKKDPLVVFESALQNVGPMMEICSRRVGGANYQIPREVSGHRRQILAFRWILASSKSKKGKPIAEVLSQELINAAANEGEAVTKKENMHKMAESNKAFAHLAW